jgi:hypothetical protein
MMIKISRVMDTKFLKEHANRIDLSEAELKEPMTEEDYDFERACETIFHM